MISKTWDTLTASEKVYLCLAELHWTESNGDTPDSWVLRWLLEMNLGFLSAYPGASCGASNINSAARSRFIIARGFADFTKENRA